MNKFFSLSIFLFFINYNSYAEIITSIANGDWTDPNVWSLGKSPGTYDTIYVYHKVIVNTDIILDHNYLNVALTGKLCGQNLTVTSQSYMEIYGEVFVHQFFIIGDTVLNRYEGWIMTTLLRVSGNNGYFFSKGRVNVVKSFLCDAPFADFSVDKQVICQNDCINFKDLSTNSPNSWQWTFEGGTPGSSIVKDPQNICYPDTGTFLVKLIASNSIGSDTIIKQFYIHVLPGLERQNYIVSKDTSLCPADTLALKLNISGVNYIWNNVSSDSVYKVAKPGIYWVDLLNSENCTYRDSIVIKAQTIPLVDLGKDGFICEGQTIVLDASFNGATYYWQDGSSKPQLALSKAGSYWVKVSNSCGSTSDSIDFTNPFIFIPNLITPNEDGKNDYFIIETNIDELSAEIYNRWGEKIFSDLRYNNEWNANDRSDGVYYYYISNKNICGIERRGWVEVIK